MTDHIFNRKIYKFPALWDSSHIHYRSIAVKAFCREALLIQLNLELPHPITLSTLRTKIKTYQKRILRQKQKLAQHQRQVSTCHPIYNLLVFPLLISHFLISSLRYCLQITVTSAPTPHQTPAAYTPLTIQLPFPGFSSLPTTEQELIRNLFHTIHLLSNSTLLSSEEYITTCASPPVLHIPSPVSKILL